MTVILIMAGGVGKRMNSDLPKVLHTLHGKPMINHVVDSALNLDESSIIYIIVGKHSKLIQDAIPSNPRVDYIYQSDPLGTGHAIQCCRDKLLNYGSETRILILSGDVPLFSTVSMQQVLSNSVSYDVTIVTTHLDNPIGYGRIVETNLGIKIIEEKDCSEEDKRICKVNCGIYAFCNQVLCDRLPMLNNNNAQNEYYLTSVIDNCPNVGMVEISKDKQHEIMGVNTAEQLCQLSIIW